MHRVSTERGFTLVEVMVGVLILLVGVAGTAAMLTGASAGTAGVKAREGGTNVARSIVEVARSVPYRDLSGDAVLAALAERPALQDAQPATPGHQVVSRNVAYDVTVTACSMDDKKDGLGVHSAGTTYCSNSLVVVAGQTAKDRNPDDYRRVIVTLTWHPTTGRTETVRQTASITNPVGGLGPSVTSLDMTSPASSPITSASTTTAAFRVRVSTPAADVAWSVNGDRKGSASADASGATWTFNWRLANSDGSPVVYDGTYVLEATAYDADGHAGATRALTIVVNRMAPLAPGHAEGGRNGNGTRVDLEWHASPEGDVIGYRVYRGSAPGALTSLACPPAGGASVTTDTSCLDDSAPPPSGSTLYYTVVAYDRAPDGSLRAGTGSESVQIVEGDLLPVAPTNLVACTGGTPNCNGQDGQPAPDHTTVISWDAATDPDGSIYFYRIYRDGETYANRFDRLYPVFGQPLVFLDSKTDGQQHTYRVSAVDKQFAESPLSVPVTR